jgi:hypothetical protein
MNGPLFDLLTRRLSTTRSRRVALRMLAAGGLLPLLALPRRTDAAEEADAKCEANNDTTRRLDVPQYGQTFRAQHTGRLTRATIEVGATNDNEDFDIEIRRVSKKGKITTTVLASATATDVPTPLVPGGTTTIAVAFSPAAEVRKDKRYALVLRRQGGAHDFHLAVNDKIFQCDGTLFEDPEADNTFVKNPFGQDMVFATFVTT